MTQQKSILVLGGTNFMGRTLLRELQRKECPQMELTLKESNGVFPMVYVVNRKKTHWNDSNHEDTENVKRYYGDRDNTVEYGKLLKYLTEKEAKRKGLNKDEGEEKEENSTFKWDLVVDFCGFLRKEVKSVIRGLSGHVKLYVFISSDSIYDVCDSTLLSVPVKEDQDIRPTDPKKIDELAEDEDYGHDKLRCEEYLRSHVGGTRGSNEFELPFVCLRLPDIIGPFDATGRFWTYLLWIQKMDVWPIHSKNESRIKPLSFVYSNDVVIQLLNFLNQSSNTDFVKKVHSQSYNLAFKENIPLDSMLNIIGKILKAGPINFITEKDLAERLSKVPGSPSKKGKYFYPSVYCPHLSIAKAETHLNWQPTPLEEALQKTCEFFVSGAHYTAEFKKAASKLLKVQEIYEGKSSEESKK